MNVGVMRVDYDAAGQFAWLEEELRKAEAEDYVVWLVGHVPPSYKDCLEGYALRYTVLIERF